MSLNISDIVFQNRSLEQKSVLASVGSFVSSELNLRTNEGDLVNLSFVGEQSLSESSTQTLNQENGTIQGYSTVARAADAYSLVVQGELNAEEMVAINKFAEEVAPLAEEFFANGELNLEDSSNVLASNLGMIQEVELVLERTVLATFETRILKRLPEESGDSANIDVPQNQAQKLKIDRVRDFPALVQVTIDAVFKSEVEQVSEQGSIQGSIQDSILRSLNDLLSYIRDRIGEFLNPPTGLVELTLEPESRTDGVASIDSPTPEKTNLLPNLSNNSLVRVADINFLSSNTYA